MKKTIPAINVLVPVLIMTVAAAHAHAQNAAPTARPPMPKPDATDQWTPVPPVVSVPASTGIPSDAIVLFDGSSLNGWESTDRNNHTPRWTLEPASRAVVVAPGAGDLRTKAAFGDVQLHIEWRSPAVVKGNSQGRGNSGVFLMDTYELQVLDSYNNNTYVNGQAGAIYKQSAPLVNPCRKPGEWNTYDILFTAPRFKEDGRLDYPARITVIFNGVVVQNNFTILGPTLNAGVPRYEKAYTGGPILLQDHKNAVSFRNIWIREL